MAIREKIIFLWKFNTLYKLFKNMNFIWKKSNPNRKILMEKSNIVASKYLKIIQYSDG